jgi:F0F1-type ATP synthase assembly protein I
MGGFIWFFITLMLEETAHKRTREKKYGKGSTEALTKEDTQGFYVLSGVVSAVLGILIGYLGSQGKL